MVDPIPISRHLAGTPATLEVTWLDQYGEPTPPVGALTVEVKQADGTVLVAAGGAVTGTDNPFSRALTPTQTASLEMLVATWTDAGNNAVRTTLHEIVGGFYFSLQDGRDWDDGLGDQERYSVERQRRVRAQVERECDFITGQAWVPRYRRVSVDGPDDVELILPDAEIRTIRSLRTYSTSTTFTPFSSGDLTELLIYDDGRVRRPGGKVFDLGDQNLVVEYEHGSDNPDDDLIEALLMRFRYRLNNPDSGLSDRADNLVIDGVGSFKLADNNDPTQYTTGMPEVDATYRRKSRRRNKVVSRNFDYDPQRTSIYHGGRR